MAEDCPIVFLGESLDRNDLQQEAKQKVIGRLRPEWQQEEVQVEVFTGGYLNSMMSFYHRLDVKKADAIVVRVYGEFQGVFNKHKPERDLVAMQVSHAAGCFPAVLAVFKNGLAYTRAPGRTLKMAGMRDETIIRSVTRKLFALHEVALDSMPLYDCEGNRVPLDRSNGFRSKMEYIIERIPEALGNEEKNIIYQQHRMNATDLRAELDFLCNAVDQLDFKICLNQLDTHIKNIVYDEETEASTLLDYELSLVTYEEMDIAYLYVNQSYMNSIKLLGKGPPIDEKTRDLWIRYYVKAKYEHMGKDPDQIPEVAFDLARVKQDIADVLMNFMFVGYTQLLMSMWDSFPGDHFVPLLHYRERLKEGKANLSEFITRYVALRAACP